MRALLAPILLVISLCSLSTALAGSGTAARKHKEAEEQLNAGETDAALALVDEGLAAAPKDKDLLLLRGHVLLRRGDYEDAAKAYRTFLASGGSGRAKRDVEKILVSLDQVANTKLVVVVKNGPAEVRLDARTGRAFCTADPECRKGVMPGDHLVVVDKPGHSRFTKRVVVAPRSTETIEVTLLPKPSPLVLKVTPPTATVTVDGGPPGKELVPGDHTIAASQQGYLAQKQTVRARNGDPVTVEITLRAGIPITIYPADAKLTIDGEPVTVTDGMLPIDPTMAGIHQLVASKPGFHAESASLPASRIDMALRPLGAYLRVDGGAGAALVVDGEARGQLPLAEPLELDGGSHTIEVRAPGRRVLRTTADLPAGRQATMHVEAHNRPRVKAWIASTITIAGLVGGAYFGREALLKQKDYDANATRAGVSVNDMTQRALADDGKRDARLSDISFAVGGVAMIAAIYWFRTEGREAAGRIEVRPLPAGVELSGKF